MAYQSGKANSRARDLRKRETAAELRLWEALRGRRLSGAKFVRQLPIGPYFADFACRESKLIIEVDRATHSEESERAHDVARTDFLTAQGWRIIRFWNQDVYENRGGVCETIMLALRGG